MHAPSSGPLFMRPSTARMSFQRAAWCLVMGLLALALLVCCTPAGQLTDPPQRALATGTPARSNTPTPAPPTPTPVPPLPGWTLVWHDEFDGTSLDMSKWNVVSNAPGGYHNCCLNGTLNAWVPDDVSLVNGSLRLKTERRSFQGAAYTSGAVTTEGKFAYLYGRLDISARVPRGDGLWPSFWLLPTSMHTANTLAAYEVDVMEALGEDVHTDYMVRWVGAEHTYCQYSGPDFSAGYHVYSFIWSSMSITWLIDGVTRCKFSRGVPNIQMYLILNTRIGGAWPVPPDASTVLPQYTDIDYVRVYVPAR
jgi:beta-glucanase (GH16 family)